MKVARSNSWFAWLQLLRLPNVFTAVANVAMGFLVTHGTLQPATHFALLAVASCLLYLSGMALNDVFDAEIDAVEQPTRPIPSGRISRQAATKVGWTLWLGGLLLGWLASFMAGEWRPGIVASLLALCIVLYDRVLKQTSIAPAVMGACRMLNVLLGMSLALHAWNTTEWLIALGVGVYIAGVTWFARTDAHRSSRAHLAAATVLLLAGIALLAASPFLKGQGWPVVITEQGWYLLWAAIAFIILRRCILAVLDPTSERVQTAVRNCIHALIALDAAVCVGFAGAYWGMIVLLLLVPTIVLAGWLKAT